MSYKCLHKNHFERAKCEIFFANYNNCKEFWVSFPKKILHSKFSYFSLFFTEFQTKVRADRRSKGIVPELPPIADRARIKDEYMKTKPS